MSTVLKDHQFELLPTEDADTGITFGIHLPVSCDSDGFDPGTREWLTQDQQDPYSGVVRSGRDVLAPSPWTWALHVNRDSEENALASMQELATAWLGRSVTSSPQAAAVIRYRVGGRYRRVYGRPRRWAAPPDNRLLSGMVPVTCDFQRIDPFHYEDAFDSVTLGLSYESAGGFVFPVVFPVITMPGGYSPGEAFVGGTVETHPIIRINGPVTNPEVFTNEWSVKLTTTILAGDYVEIDTRPWKRTVLRDDGGSVAGILGPRTRLRDIVLQPGQQSFGFRGFSAEGTGSATIKWYPAHASL
jgi:hypothetical protein